MDRGAVMGGNRVQSLHERHKWPSDRRSKHAHAVGRDRDVDLARAMRVVTSRVPVSWLAVPGLLTPWDQHAPHNAACDCTVTALHHATGLNSRASNEGGGPQMDTHYCNPCRHEPTVVTRGRDVSLHDVSLTPRFWGSSVWRSR
jgi:hypothetical protein